MTPITALGSRYGIQGALGRSVKRASTGGIVVYDTFTDTDATALTAHAPDIVPSGKAWENIVSTGVIYNNRAQQELDGSSVIDCGYSDCVITANILSSYEASGIESRQCGLVFRYDGTDYWKVTANVNTDSFYIVEPGVGIVASTAVAIGASELLTIVVTLSGNSITATLNGANTISTTSTTNATATKHGYWLFRRPYLSYCDNFKIEI